jgi:hypothetical protein
MYRLGATLPSLVNRLEDLGAKFIPWDQAGLPKGLFTSPKRDFGPRLGFAYRLDQGARSFLLRGGYRISYFRISARAWWAPMGLNPPLNAYFVNNPDYAARSPDGIGNYTLRTPPTIIAGVNSRDAVTLDTVSFLSRGSGSTQVNYFAQDQPDARVQDWNLTVEKEVMKNTVFRATYVGNHGSNLEQYYWFNQNPTDYIWYMTTGEPIPTGEFANVARRPYDQQVYGGVNEYLMSGWSNFQGVQFEIERRYSDGYGFQFFYNMGNALRAGGQHWSGSSRIDHHKNYLPGAVPTDIDERNRFLNYSRDTSIPKHRVRWNWIVDLPFGRGKPLGRKVNSVLDKFIGGWQIAGMGSLRSNYFRLPSSRNVKGIYPNGNPIEIYGYKYPIQDCRPGKGCSPGFLWWNGYLPANQINSVDANGKPNGYMGVPANYRPAGEPLIPWPADPASDTRLAPDGEPLSDYFETNTVWITLNNGRLEQTTYNDNLHPWRNQYFPSVRQWGLDASLFKTIPINERFKIRFNADFFNVLNNPGNPNSVADSGILETRMSGQAARELQLTLRLIW